MMEQVERKIKGVTKQCILVKHEDYGDDLLYCAVKFAIVTWKGSEDDFFPIKLQNHPTSLFGMVLFMRLVTRNNPTMTLFIILGMMPKIWHK